MMVRVLVVIGLAAIVGCQRQGAAPFPAVGREHSARLQASSALGCEVMLRQRLLVNYRERTHSVEAVLQVEEDLARVLFLTPFGARALLVEQRGLTVREERYVPMELPFPPHYILLDIQRVWFPMGSKRPRADGDHEFLAGGELVRETWRGRRLLHRELRRDSSHRGSIQISYDEPSAGQPPRRVVLVNERLGYTLVIETTATEFLSERACPNWWVVTP